MLRTKSTALALAMLLAPATLAGGSEAASVLSALKVSKGSVEWHGLLLGMPLTEVEKLLGQSIHLTDRSQYVEAPCARVVVDKRSVRLTFWKSDGNMILKGLVIERMAFESPESWTRQGLVESLSSTGVEATQRNAREQAPGERFELPILYVFPKAPGIQLLLKAQEGAIYLGFDEYFVD
jgi:hypothetical protein